VRDDPAGNDADIVEDEILKLKKCVIPILRLVARSRFEFKAAADIAFKASPGMGQRSETSPAEGPLSA